MTSTTHLRFTATCPECQFTSADIALLNTHSCSIALQGGACEDYPACGHEAGDCNGLLYGSDESIKAQVYEAIRTGHGSCDHADGFYDCDDMGDEGDEDDDNDEPYSEMRAAYYDNDHD